MKKELFLFYFLLNVACANQNSTINTLTFDISKDTQIMLSDITDNLIEIKPDNNVLLKDIKQVEFFENIILIRDAKSEINVFDMDGKYIRQIGNIGQGPGEYTLCTGLGLDKIRKHILLKTNIGIMIYDIEGNFIDKIPERPRTFLYYNGLYYTVENKFSRSEGKYYQDTYLSIYDENYTEINKLLRNREESSTLTIKTRGLDKPVFNDGNNIYYFLTGSMSKQETIYLFNNNQLNPFLDIKLVGGETQDELYHAFISGRYVVVKYLTRIQLENSSTYSLSQCLYDDKTKKTRHAKYGFTDDIYNRGNVIINPLLEQNMFYYIKEENYSNAMKMEPNPTVYIGIFKK